MASIVTKRIKGNDYLYLVDSKREGKRVIQKTIKYISKKRPIPKEEFSCMEYSYKNKDWILTKEEHLPYTLHKKLGEASEQQKAYRKTLSPVAQEKAKEKFLSKFIANSNAIEGSTLTPKETHDYLFADVVPRKTKKELFMADNLLRAWKYMEAHHKRRPTQDDIKQLHKLVNEGLEEETLGHFKRQQNYIGDILTTSHLFVEEKMAQLLEWIEQSERRINEFEVAFQSHAQFEVIHPFVDGNGRVGRVLLNWQLMRKRREPLAIPVASRLEYIEALENSRRGSVKAICIFLAEKYLEEHSFAPILKKKA